MTRNKHVLVDFKDEVGPSVKFGGEGRGITLASGFVSGSATFSSISTGLEILATTLRSEIKFLSQTASFAASDAAMYSTSVVESAMVSYFELFHEIVPPFRLKYAEMAIRILMELNIDCNTPLKRNRKCINYTAYSIRYRDQDQEMNESVLTSIDPDHRSEDLLKTSRSYSRTISEVEELSDDRTSMLVI
ncbi:hypothetical protein OSB04_023985 [Centaurea solstitialis]|uniref:Uncharacterized protein n=1 Tax=Centaurea solstitialis TaxID=347529 RepID=A0AA38SST1_9ASTR|nr:hypothetical protein OSB04_023985 [Centaurea solstitialis]